MKEQFINWNPRSDTLTLIHYANSIIKEYQDQDYVLTLRQLYYQFVARDIIENTNKSYKNLGNMINKARQAGLIDWEAIEDRNRSLTSYKINSDIPTIIRHTVYDLWYDLWEEQDYYLEVWVEKDALGNVVERACNKYRVPNMACKGYLSASMAYEAGKRLEEKIDQGKQVVIIHLGDHDPSGLDMTRDNQERIDLFTRTLPSTVQVRRIALNMDQVDQYSPPPNPAKLQDTRAKDYILEYGMQSWELDALEPSVLSTLISETINEYVDHDLMNETLLQEREAKDKLELLSDIWHEVDGMLEERKNAY